MTEKILRCQRKLCPGILTKITKDFGYPPNLVRGEVIQILECPKCHMRHEIFSDFSVREVIKRFGDV